MAKIGGENQPELDEAFYHLQAEFYPSSSNPRTPSKTPKASAPGLVTLDMGDIRTYEPATIADKLVPLADEHDMPLPEQFKAYNKIRVGLAMKEKASRQKMLVIRLLTLACLVSLSTEENAQSTIFLYEPDLINHVAETLRVDSLDDMVVASGIFALDACSRHRSKGPEVLSAIGFNTRHGLLMSLVRATVNRLVSGPLPAVELVDSLFSMIAFIIAGMVHGGALLGAGLLPALLDMLKMQNERRDSYIPRAAGLIDSAMMSGTSTLQTLNSIDGLNVLVVAIKAEITHVLDAVVPEPTDIWSHETIITNISQPLKSMLRTVHRLMSTAGGTEGLRTLVDSDLPKCLKMIFEQPTKFGNRVTSIGELKNLYSG